MKIKTYPNLNYLALTVLINAGKIHKLNSGKVKDWEKDGWEFSFEKRENEIFAVIEGVFPHGKEKIEALASIEVANLIEEYSVN